MSVTARTLKSLLNAWGNVPIHGASLTALGAAADLPDDAALTTKADGHAMAPLERLEVVMGPDGEPFLDGVAADGLACVRDNVLLSISDAPNRMEIRLEGMPPLDEISEASIDTDRPAGGGLALLRMARVHKIEWMQLGTGRIDVVQLDSHEVSLNRAGDVLHDYSSGGDPRRSSVTQLLARLGAEAVTRDDVMKHRSIQVEFSFDDGGYYQRDAIVRDHTSVHRYDAFDSTAPGEYLGEAALDVPAFKSPLSLTLRHGFKSCLIQDSRVVVPTEGRSEDELNSFVEDLDGSGWEVAHRRDSDGEVALDVQWKGRLWAFMPVRDVDHPASGFTVGCGSECEARDAMAESEGNGMVIHSTRSARDGRLMVLYDGGNGWRDRMDDALSAESKGHGGLGR